MPLNRYNDFRNLIAAQYSVTTQDMVDRAILFAWERLINIRRYDNSPMLDHAIGVARIVVEEIGLGRNSTIAAIIHDVVRIAFQEHDPSLDELLATIRQEKFSCSLPEVFCCSVVQSLSSVRLFPIPRTAALQPSLSFTISQSLLKFMSIELVMPSNHLILCHPLLLLPSIFPIRVFSNESVLSCPNAVTRGSFWFFR